MNAMFEKLMAKKKAEGKDMSPVEKTANKNVLGDLMSFLNNHEGEKLKGLKKVTVASDDPEGLKMGLDKAKDIIDKGEDHGDEAGMEDSDEDQDLADIGDDESGTEEDHSSDDSQDSDEDQEHEGHGQPSMEDMMKQIEMLKAQLAARG
jgi:hypothetical protein